MQATYRLADKNNETGIDMSGKNTYSNSSQSTASTITGQQAMIHHQQLNLLAAFIWYCGSPSCGNDTVRASSFFSV